MSGQQRIEPGPGQESVWDYPRPPRLEESNKHIQVICNGVVIADTHRAKRILETSHPPVYSWPGQEQPILTKRISLTRNASISGDVPIPI